MLTELKNLYIFSFMAVAFFISAAIIVISCYDFFMRGEYIIGGMLAFSTILFIVFVAQDLYRAYKQRKSISSKGEQS